MTAAERFSVRIALAIVNALAPPRCPGYREDTSTHLEACRHLLQGATPHCSLERLLQLDQFFLRASASLA